LPKGGVSALIFASLVLHLLLLLCWQWKLIHPHFELGGVIKMDEAIPFGGFFVLSWCDG